MLQYIICTSFGKHSDLVSSVYKGFYWCAACRVSATCRRLCIVIGYCGCNWWFLSIRHLQEGFVQFWWHLRCLLVLSLSS